MQPRYGRPQERDWNELSDDAFRAIVRADVEQHYPARLRYWPRRILWDEQADWIEHLLERNWTAPGWPAEMGGMGLSPVKQLIFTEEHLRFGAAVYDEHGIVQVGPVIARFGTREQQDRWLPPALLAEHHWAQGYSEPEAGSDLASVRTRATRDGEDYIVNGHKIWTTLAHVATHIYFLARTRLEGRKQAGISFFVADITTPGISVRPLRDIAGNTELCEVFFDDVRIPAMNRIGEENNGWTIAKAVLGHERLVQGSPADAEYGLHVLRAVAEARGLADEPVFSDRYAQVRLDVAHLTDVYAGYKEQLERGADIGPEASMLKIFATETYAAIADLMIETAGEAGGLGGGEVTVGDASIDVMQHFYRARSATIFAGSNEIQRNILATSVLGLPRG